MDGDLDCLKKLASKIQLLNNVGSDLNLARSATSLLSAVSDLTSVNSSQILLRSLPLNKHGWTVLNAACYFGKLDIVKYLITEHKCDPNSQNNNGWHSLMFAIMGSSVYSHFDGGKNVLLIVDYLIRESKINT